MPNIEHLEILKSGRESWNNWIRDYWKNKTSSVRIGHDIVYVPGKSADLSGLDLSSFEDLSGHDFYKVDFSNTNLNNVLFKGCRFRKAEFNGAKIKKCVFDHSNLDSCYLMYANVMESSFKNCSLIKANLGNSNFYKANFSNSSLVSASLQWTKFIETKFGSTDLSNSFVFGSSIWDCDFTAAKQNNIVITKADEPIISIDNIEIGQFIHLLLNNKKLRNVIDTITTKVILILGRFTEDRKVVLNGIKDELRQMNYLPILYDFENSKNRNSTEAISTLAHLSRFIIADLTDHRSVPHELAMIAPKLPSVPIQPILLKGHSEYGMYDYWSNFPWILDIIHYSDLKEIKETIVHTPDLANGKH